MLHHSFTIHPFAIIHPQTLLTSGRPVLKLFHPTLHWSRILWGHLLVYNPWKHQKTSSFLLFSGVVEWERGFHSNFEVLQNGVKKIANCSFSSFKCYMRSYGRTGDLVCFLWQLTLLASWFLHLQFSGGRKPKYFFHRKLILRKST